LKDVGLAGFEDASAAPFGIAAYRPGTSVELPRIHIHWIEGDPANSRAGRAEDAPATGAASAFVSAVACATDLRATDLPLLPEVLVDLHLIHADHEEVVR
jgi:CO/xanthine dehydrogenase Mo-binding subunit